MGGLEILSIDKLKLSCFPQPFLLSFLCLFRVLTRVVVDGSTSLRWTSSTGNQRPPQSSLVSEFGVGAGYILEDGSMGGWIGTSIVLLGLRSSGHPEHERPFAQHCEAELNTMCCKAHQRSKKRAKCLLVDGTCSAERIKT